METPQEEYKIVYYKKNDKQMYIDKVKGKVWLEPDSEYKQHCVRIYPVDYEPENGYGSEELIDSW